MEELVLKDLKKDIIEIRDRHYRKRENHVDIYEIIPAKDATEKILQARIYRLWPMNNLKLSTVNLVLIGETGKGKTLLVNSILNYVMDIDSEQRYRFSVPLYSSKSNKGNVDSQTEEISLYKIPYIEGMRNKNNFVIVDTPGMLDTRGQKVQKMNLEKIKSFLKKYKFKGRINIGIVVEANLGSIGHIKRNIHDIRNTLPKGRIFLIATFADALLTPECYSAFEKEYTKLDNKFKINNSIVFSAPFKNVNNDFKYAWGKRKRQIEPIMEYISKKPSDEDKEDASGSLAIRYGNTLLIRTPSITSTETNTSYQSAQASWGNTFRRSSLMRYSRRRSNVHEEISWKGRSSSNCSSETSSIYQSAQESLTSSIGRRSDISNMISSNPVIEFKNYDKKKKIKEEKVKDSKTMKADSSKFSTTILATNLSDVSTDEITTAHTSEINNSVLTTALDNMNSQAAKYTSRISSSETISNSRQSSLTTEKLPSISTINATNLPSQPSNKLKTKVSHSEESIGGEHNVVTSLLIPPETMQRHRQDYMDFREQLSPVSTLKKQYKIEESKYFDNLFLTTPSELFSSSPPALFSCSPPALLATPFHFMRY